MLIIIQNLCFRISEQSHSIVVKKTRRTRPKRYEISGYYNMNIMKQIFFPTWRMHATERYFFLINTAHARTLAFKNSNNTHIWNVNLQQILPISYKILLQDIRALPTNVQTRTHGTHLKRYKYSNYYIKDII